MSREGLVSMEADYKRAAKEQQDTKCHEEALDVEGEGKVTPRVAVPEEVLSILEKLVEDRRNEVWLLSGLRMQGVLERIAERVPGLGIVYVFFFFLSLFNVEGADNGRDSAENGCFVKTINKRQNTIHRSSSSSAGTSPLLPASPSSPKSSFHAHFLASPPNTPSALPKFSLSSPKQYAREIARNGWVSLVANFNLTWRGPCLEILHYVSILLFLSSRIPI